MTIILYIPWSVEADGKGLLNSAILHENRLDWQEKRNIILDRAHFEEENGKSFQYSPDDIIYLFGHGNKGLNDIYSSLNASAKKMSVKELVGQLDGILDKNHKQIRVWTCFSGVGMRDGQGLAGQLWQAMHNAGFNQLTVYGYTETIVDPTSRTFNKAAVAAEIKAGFISIASTPNLIEIKPLPGTPKNYRIGKDENGNLITPAPLPRSIKPCIS